MVPQSPVADGGDGVPHLPLHVVPFPRLLVAAVRAVPVRRDPPGPAGHAADPVAEGPGSGAAGPEPSCGAPSGAGRPEAWSVPAGGAGAGACGGAGGTGGAGAGTGAAGGTAGGSGGGSGTADRAYPHAPQNRSPGCNGSEQPGQAAS